MVFLISTSTINIMTSGEPTSGISNGIYMLNVQVISIVYTLVSQYFNWIFGGVVFVVIIRVLVAILIVVICEFCGRKRKQGNQ